MTCAQRRRSAWQHFYRLPLSAPSLAGTAIGTMRRRSLTLTLLLLIAALAAGPALAEVLAEGKVKGGYY